MSSDIDVSLAKGHITSYFNPVVWEQMKGMAESFVKSGAFPQGDNAAKLLVKMQAGFEMGMKPIEAIKSFYFVNGSLNIFGAAVIKRLREHGWTISYKDEPNKCTATISKGEETFTDVFTFEEAQKSGYTGYQNKLKQGWIEGANRNLKLRYGVISKMIKTYVPEVLGSAVDIAEIAEDAAIINTPILPESLDDNDPATDTQLDTLKNIGVDAPEGITKGQAKQLIIESTKE